MMWIALMLAVASMGLFASRAFLPAFAAAALLRFAPQFTWLGQWGLLGYAGDVPTWFTHDITILVLGLLALIELAANHQHELRELLDTLDRIYKPALAALTQLGILSSADAAFIDHTLDSSQRADVMPFVAAGMTAGGVYVLATARAAAMRMLRDVDEFDDTAAHRLIAWAEDLWALGGMLLLILLPVLAVVLSMLAGLMLLVLERRARRREEQSKVPCAACGHPIHRAALHCPRCAHAHVDTQPLGYFGQAVVGRVPHPATHALDLAEFRRCSRCATRLPKRQPRQTCPACAHPHMRDPAFTRAFQQRIERRLPAVLLISFLLSLVPLIGLIPGIIHYRLRLIAPYRRHLPPLRSITTRWLVRFIMLLLIILQVVPLLGSLALPSMALINFTLYRRAYQRLLIA